MQQNLRLRIKNILQSDGFIISLLYMMSYGMIVLNNGLYYDDWVLFNQTSFTRIQLLKDLGFFLQWPAYLHNVLFPISYSVYIERLIIFISYLAAALFLNVTLKKIDGIDQKSRLFIVMFFALFPVNFARIAICNIHYAICYALFFMGLWLVSRATANILLRITALLILFLSFSTNSLLVFYILVPVLLVYQKRHKIRSVNIFWKFWAKHLDFCILPILFFFIKKQFFPTLGLYAAEGYNTITLQNIKELPLHAARTIAHLGFGSLKIFFAVLIYHPILLVIITCGAYLAMQHISQHTENTKSDSRVYTMRWLCVGIVVLGAAIFPYLAIGAAPRYWDCQSRHQLLMPLGIALILYYGLQCMFERIQLHTKPQILIHSLLISFCVVALLGINIRYQKDCFKQLSLRENFKNSEIIRNHTSFIFTDNVPELNAQQRVYRFYEYTGLMKWALGDETRFGERSTAFKDISNYAGLIKYPQYNISKFLLTKPEYDVTINHGTYTMTLGNVIQLWWLHCFNKERYKQLLRNIISLDYKPLS